MPGVGQSLYSSHLDAVYKPNHKFIDPNIWYDETEMRKQVEQAAGCFILTAQEKPENCRKMREDLFKKTMSADGIAGRKPYGYETRMIELVGWKRYEVNSMIRFTGVSEKNFYSVFRRGLVWEPKARFIEGAIIDVHYPDAHQDGYFRKDDGLKSFLKSEPCIAAALRLQHAFEISESAETCRSMIETYAAQPLTEDRMREACGLKPRKRSEEPHPNLHVPVDPESQDERDVFLDKLKNVLLSVQEYCLDNKKFVITKGMWKYFKLPANHPTELDKDKIWDALLQHKLMIQLDVKSEKYKDAAMPCVLVNKRLDELIAMSAECKVPIHQEIHDLEAVRKYAFGNADRETNVCTLLEHCDLCVKAIQHTGKTGKPDAARLEKKAQYERLIKKIHEGEKTLNRLLAQAETSTSSQPAKRRRLRKSAPASSIQESEQTLSTSPTAAHIRYERSFHDLVRARAYARDAGAQCASRRLQRVLCPNTHDLDIQNSIFCLLLQLLQKLNTNHCIRQDVLDVFQRCAQDRAGVCSQELKTSLPEGKRLLQQCLFGGSLPNSLVNNSFMNNFQRAALYLRWLAYGRVLAECVDSHSCECKEQRRLPD